MFGPSKVNVFIVLFCLFLLFFNGHCNKRFNWNSVILIKVYHQNCAQGLVLNATEIGYVLFNEFIYCLIPHVAYYNVSKQHVCI